MKKTAKALAALGRHGDTELVHLSKGEVRALHGIASLAGRKLTTNPKTGLTEAFNLVDLLPLALNFIFPGMGTVAQIGVGALSGAASSAIEGNDPLTGALTGGVMSGLGGALFGGGDAATQAALNNAGNVAGQGAATAVGNTAADAAATALLPQTIERGAATALGEAASPGFLTDLAGAGSDQAVGDFFGNLVTKENLPWTMAGGAALASLMPAGGVDAPAQRKWKVAQPAAPRTYTPAPSNWLAGFDPEFNMFSPNPGPYYQGDPNYRGYAQGGQVGIGTLPSTLPPQVRSALEKIGGGRGWGRPGGGQVAPLTLPPRTVAQHPQTQFPPGTTVSGHAVLAPPSITPKLFSPPVAMAAGGGIGSMGGGKEAILQQLLGRHIGGAGNGMDDDVSAVIDGQQPARLSSGEFVVPADAVSMLGDGNTNAGVNRLQGMIRDIRVAKTGTAKQAEPISMEPVNDDPIPTIQPKESAKEARRERWRRARQADEEFNRKKYEEPRDDIEEGVRAANEKPFVHDFENHLEGLSNGAWAMRDEQPGMGNTTPVLTSTERWRPVAAGISSHLFADPDRVTTLTPESQMDRYVTNMRTGVRHGISSMITNKDRAAQEARVNAMTRDQDPGLQEMIARYMREKDPAKRNAMRRALHSMGVGVPGPKVGIGQWRQPLVSGGFKYQ